MSERHRLAAHRSRAADAPPEQLSPGRAVALHLLPGVPVLAVILLASPLVTAAGLPVVAAAYLAILVALVPVELGYLLRRTRPGVLRAQLGLRGGPPPRRLAAVVAAVLAVQAGVYALVWGPLEEVLRPLTAWLPDVLLRADVEDPAAFGPTALLVTWTLGLVANGFVGPVVEELYFRGHLLPRMARYGAAAPVLNALLFSAYHLFAPWQLLSRFLFALPFVAAVWRTRSVGLGIVVHVVNNVAAMLLLLPAYLAAAA